MLSGGEHENRSESPAELDFSEGEPRDDRRLQKDVALESSLDYRRVHPPTIGMAWKHR